MSSFRLRLTKEDSTGDIQLLKGYQSVLRVSPFTTNSIVGVEAEDAPGYYDFADVQTGVLYQRWNGTTLANLTMDKSFSGDAGQVVIGSSGTTIASQSDTIIRVIPSADSNLTGKVYTTLATAQTYANTVNASDFEINISIEGNGATADNLLPSSAGVGTLQSYINYSGINPSSVINLATIDTTYTADLNTDGTRINFTNIRFNQTVQEITTTFVNCEFINCMFATLIQDVNYLNAYEFQNCQFLDCKLYAIDNVSYDSSCLGQISLEGATTYLSSYVIGANTIISKTGNVTPRLLLGSGASNVTLSTGGLTLGATNYNVMSETNSGAGLYVITSSLTAGSYFQLKVVTGSFIRHMQTNIYLLCRKDRPTFSGEIITFFYDGTNYIEIGSSIKRLTSIYSTSALQLDGKLTLGSGNYCIMTGTGSGHLTLIDTRGWNIGSEIMIEVQTGSNVNNLAATDGTYFGLKLIGATNRATTSGDLLKFVLQTSYWKEIKTT